MDKTEKYTVTILSENKPGILYRIAGVFFRRKINVESLTVFETETPGLSEFTIIANITPYNAKRVVENVRKIVEVHRAIINMKQT